jgi:hypothetical protein
MNQLIWKYGGTLLLLLALTACGQTPAETSGNTSTEPSHGAVTSHGGNTEPGQGAVTIGGNTSTEPGQGAVTSHGGAVTNHVSFVDSLRAKGLMVEPASSVEQPFLGAKGELLRVSGGGLKQPAEVQSFEYPSADAAAADLAKIGANGQPEGTMVEWKGAPHFFHKEKLVVLYVGDDQAMLDMLSGAMGPQVAGR